MIYRLNASLTFNCYWKEKKAGEEKKKHVPLYSYLTNDYVAKLWPIVLQYG